jgi:hypothetical protein
LEGVRDARQETGDRRQETGDSGRRQINTSKPGPRIEKRGGRLFLFIVKNIYVNRFRNGELIPAPQSAGLE